MKLVLSSVVAIAAIALPLKAQEPSDTRDKDTSQTIDLVIHRKSDPCVPMRAPMHVSIEAYYDEFTKNLSISCDGNVSGDVYLYLEGSLVGYNTEINSSFHISNPGFYIIEIIGETWIAQGDLQLSNNQ